MANNAARYGFPASSATLRQVKEIQFGLFSAQETERLAVIDVEYPETMDEQRIRARERGPNDPHLGTIDRNFKCATCEENQDVCPGHFGVIKLAQPVYHYGFLSKVKKLLETVCHNCGKIKAPDGPELKAALRSRSRKDRFEKVWRLSKPISICAADSPDDGDGESKDKDVVRHGGCGNAQPAIRKTALKLMAHYKRSKGSDDDSGSDPAPQRIWPSDALNVFKLISDEDLEKMGISIDYAHPEWMILTALPVPPPPVRPSISVDGSGQGQRGEDDLTFKLGDIIRANQAVMRCEVDGTPDHIKHDLMDLLQYHIATYMDNDIAGLDRAQHKSGRPIKSIRARLKGKEGRLRQNLMGKRVDFSARTVITGDPNLSLDEVGVPRSIARTLTYPVKVTEWNRDKLGELVRNGTENWPGARYVIRDDGEKINLSRSKGDFTLQVGWTVERHLQDGDIILFNRQPSLHKESMMAHRVKVMPYSTFRLNLSVTSPYNADFDGDEMNLHVPQSEESKSELRNLCLVPLNIVSPQGNKPLMGIIQDSLCGIYKITRRDVFLTRDEVMNMMMWVPDWDGVIPTPAIIKPRPRWTGKQMISMILPPSLNMERIESKEKDAWLPFKDDGALILGGELMFGLLSKKYVGSASGGVVHITCNEFGPDVALTFFNGAQRVVNYWLLHHGFSIGIGDTVPDLETVDKIQAAVDTQKDIVAQISKKAYDNELEPAPGMTVRQTFESKVMAALNKARDTAGNDTQDSLKDLNDAVQMARSGSKGTTINIAQMTALVGQQAVEGKRIPFGFKYRTLPHFAKDDYSAPSRGFVENSYLRGLTPNEFFFHAMAGREGLIDTAVKTAETGYIQRRLVKALEEATVKYDGTVRDSHGNVIQFIYGEDGLDGSHIENQPVDIITQSDKAFRQRYYVDIMDHKDKDFGGKLLQYKSLVGDTALQELFDDEFDALTQSREFFRSMGKGKDEMFQLPLNIARIINQAQKNFKLRKGDSTDLDPRHVITSVRSLLDRLTVVRGDSAIAQDAQNNATLLIKGQIRSKLAFKRLVNEHALTTIAFNNVIGSIEQRWVNALVAPGEMVGVLAAQSIGEPATQMTLNTFHFTGVSAKNVTLGVPRLKEILNVTPNIKTPSMTVYMTGKPQFDQTAALDLRSKIQHTNLRSVTETCELWYDPEVTQTVIEEDQEMVDAYWMTENPDDHHATAHSKWLLRIVMSRAKLHDKRLNITDVLSKIKQNFGQDVHAINSDVNSEPVIRLRLTRSNEEKDEDDLGETRGDDYVLRRFLNEMLDNLTFHGVPGVERAFLDTKPRSFINADGSVDASADDPRGKENVLETSGSAFAKTLSIEGVDPTRLYTNRFTEIHEVLGIEAARAAIGRELTQVLSFDGSYVNYRHMAILCDGMTFRGHVSAISRHGINKSDNGPLMRCSFEQTVEILYDAAANGELDDCTGVTENIILGQPAPVGTGHMDILLDQNMLMNVADNARLGLGGAVGIKSQQQLLEGAATPYGGGDSPYADNRTGSPDYTANFSPIANTDGDGPHGFSEYNPGSGFGGMSPYGRSPGAYSPASPGFGGRTSPVSPAYSPGGGAHMYSPSSPMFGGTSPGFGATSPSFSPASPGFTPTSPAYSPTSPSYNQASPTSPGYSPSSPNYSPTSPGYSPTPTSPQYSPTSPAYGGGSKQSPTSPNYSPTSPTFSPTSPTSPTSPVYSPTSPQYNASPRSPGGYNRNGPTSPQYSPNSPAYSPNSPKEDDDD
ncbi:hypothetical protein DV737_g4960, partial [Chaetothyriales sp. CBS 132003]